MVIGTARIRLHLPKSHSLKEKRQIIKSILERVRTHLNVSISEVDSQDKWQLVTLGVACVSNDKSLANRIISKTVDFITNSKGDFQLLDYEVEIL